MTASDAKNPPVSFVEPLVLVQDLAGELGITVETAIALLDRAGAVLREDWSETLGAAASDAAKVVREFRHGNEEHQRRWSAYQDFVVARDGERATVGQQAYSDRYNRLSHEEFAHLGDAYAGFSFQGMETGYAASPRVRSIAREAREAAMAEYDAKNPPLSFEEWGRKHGKES